MEISNSNPSHYLNELPLKSLGESFEGTFAMSLQRNPMNQSFFHSQLSNNALFSFSIGEGAIKSESLINQAHEKRINEIFVDENVLYSCSNDSTVKLWDLNTNKMIKSFKKNPEEIFTISKSKHILAGGASGKIIFWDLRVMKERFIFADSHDDDVTKLEFHPDFSTLLLSGSLDGILCLFDLAKENEEEAIEAMIREKQPIDFCGFGANKDWAYIISTVGSISLVNLPESTISFSVNVIENNENNQCYLIECEKDNQEIIYYRGNHNGYVEEFKLEKNAKVRAKISFSDSKYVRCCKTLKNTNLKLIGSEDGTISIIKAEEIVIEPENQYGLTENDIFMEEEKNEDFLISDNKKKKKFRNENHFDPLRK